MSDEAVVVWVMVAIAFMSVVTIASGAWVETRRLEVERLELLHKLETIKCEYETEEHNE